MLGQIKRVIIHQMMNYVCQCSNNCFNALLKTMGRCDLWGGRQTCSRTNIGKSCQGSPLRREKFFFGKGDNFQHEDQLTSH